MTSAFACLRYDDICFKMQDVILKHSACTQLKPFYLENSDKFRQYGEQSYELYLQNVIHWFS